MSEPETPPPRPAPRFVPTLTEVVPQAPAAAAAMPDHAGQPELAAPMPVSPELADLLLRQLGPELEQRIQQAVRHAVHEQMRGFEAQLQRQLGQAVRELLAERMTQDKKAEEVRANT